MDAFKRMKRGVMICKLLCQSLWQKNDEISYKLLLKLMTVIRTESQLHIYISSKFIIVKINNFFIVRNIHFSCVYSCVIHVSTVDNCISWNLEKKDTNLTYAETIFFLPWFSYNIFNHARLFITLFVRYLSF